MTILDYIKTLKVDKTPEAIKQTAEMILANKTIFSMIGQNSPIDWAQTALSKLKMYDEAKANGELDKPATNNKKSERYGMTKGESALNDAFQWITGVKQNSARQSFIQRYSKTSKDLSSKIANELSNIANTLDIPANISPEERKVLETRAAKMTQDNAELIKAADALGVKVPTILKTASGFIPSSEATLGVDRNMREGEATIIAKNDKTGLYEIKGTQSGNVLATAPTEAEALALQTQRQAGGTPSIAGRPDLYAIAPTQAEQQATYGKAGASYIDPASGQTITPSVATPEQLAQATTGTLESFNTAQGIAATPATTPATTTETGSVTSDPNAINPATGLPNSMNELTASLTPQDIQDLQATYNGAQKSDDMITKVMNFQQITDDDMKGFLAKAKAENDPYYNQIFTRAGQDFEYSLNYMKQQREMQLEQERLAYEDKKRAEQANLEASGMTNTGEAVRRLGKESAFTKEQLGSMLPEGALPTEQRLMVSSNLANFQKSLRDYTRQAEDVYGSATLGGLNTPTLNGEKLYQAPTNQVYGSLQREQTTNEQVRASQLAEEERKRRAETLAAEGGVTTV